MTRELGVKRQARLRPDYRQNLSPRSPGVGAGAMRPPVRLGASTAPALAPCGRSGDPRRRSRAWPRPGDRAAVATSGRPRSARSRSSRTSGISPRNGIPSSLGHARAAAVAEDLVALAAAGADVVAHVLDHAEHRHVDLRGTCATPRLHVEQRDVLRRRHDHAAGRAATLLRERELRVAGAGRQVEDQAVELAPVDVAEELRSASLVTIGPRQMTGGRASMKKPIEIDLDAVALERHDALARRVTRPARSSSPSISGTLGP